MPDDVANSTLAHLLQEKADALRAARERLARQGLVYWNGLGEVLEATDRFATNKTTSAEFVNLLVRKYGLFVTAFDRLTKEDVPLALEFMEIVVAIRRVRGADGSSGQTVS